jgi:hypothetical protein
MSAYQGLDTEPQASAPSPRMWLNHGMGVDRVLWMSRHTEQRVDWWRAASTRHIGGGHHKLIRLRYRHACMHSGDLENGASICMNRTQKTEPAGWTAHLAVTRRPLARFWFTRVCSEGIPRCGLP